MDEADAALVQQLAVLVLGVDDDEARLVVGEMALDQRQRALADRAEADHHDRAVDAGMHGPLGHRASPGAGRRAQTEGAARISLARRRGKMTVGVMRRARPARPRPVPGRPAWCADAERGRAHRQSAASDELQGEQPLGLTGPRHRERGGLRRREAEAAVIGRVADQQHGGVAGLGAARIARRIRAAPMPRRRQAGCTASGPSSNAGRPPADTGHSRTVPITRRSASATNDSAGSRRPRRRWDGLVKRTRAVGEVEQRLARRDVGRLFGTDRDHGIPPRPGAGAPPTCGTPARVTRRGASLRCGRTAAARSR